jgi:hypothetical protein
MKAPVPRKELPGPDDGQRRSRALKSAIALRECSQGPQSGGTGRRTFRSLMREQALRWRHVGVAVS